MSYFVDPNTQQVYYQTPAQQTVTDSGATTTATSEPKLYAVPVQQAPAAPAKTTTSFLGLEVGSATFWTGAALGAGVALLSTSQTVQQAVVKTVSKGVAAATAGVEEFKEKFEDAKVEVEAEAAGKTQ